MPLYKALDKDEYVVNDGYDLDVDGSPINTSIQTRELLGGLPAEIPAGMPDVISVNLRSVIHESRECSMLTNIFCFMNSL